ncbi:MAG: thiosulfate oxidation carrier protein SoxY [Sulfurifustis sp.]
MVKLNRRVFLKGILASALARLAGAAVLVGPLRAFAAEWPRDAYSAKTVDEALKNLYGTNAVATSSEVKIRAPLQAENGAVVPVAVSTTLPDAQAISIIVDKNPVPLVAHVNLTPDAVPFFGTNIKMASTSDVHFVVRAGGKLYGVKQNIKVTVGGCGG